MAETAPAPRVAIADALLARREDRPGGYDLRATLNTVREGVQQVTDAAALRQILAGIAEVRSLDQPPGKDEVGTIEKVVEIGKTLVGTPSDREKALREELDAERVRRQRLEEGLAELKDELWKLQRDRRSEERDASITMVQAFSAMMDKFMEYANRAQQPAENDPLRQIGTVVLQSFVNRKPGEDLEHVKEVLTTLKDLGVIQNQGNPGNALAGATQDRELLKILLDYNLGLYRTEKETQAAVKQAEATAKRIEQIAPTLGVLGTAFLARMAGEDPAKQMAQTLTGTAPQAPSAPEAPPADRPPPTPVPRGSGRPQLIHCAGCGYEFVTREPLTEFVCPRCRQEMTLAREA
jgi:hypothetical protein